MKTRVMKRGSEWVAAVTVVDQAQDEEGLIDFGSSCEEGSLTRVLDSFLTAAKQIPAECVGKARCEIRCVEGEEDSSYPYVEINYERAATAAEIAAHEQLEPADGGVR